MGLLFVGPVFAQEHGSSEKVFKVGTLAPEGSIWMEMIRNIIFTAQKRAFFSDKKSAGRVKFAVYGSGVMGDEIEMVRKMERGELHMGGFAGSGTAAIAPEMSVLELPFLFESWEEVDYVRERFFPTFKKYFEQRGFVLLSILDQGFVQVFANHPVRTPDELAQQKLVVWSGEPVDMESFRALGLNTLSLGFHEILPGLRSGRIDAVYNSPLACLVLQWFTHIKYLIDIDLRYEPAVFVMTKKAWDSLPPPYRKFMENLHEKYAAAALTGIRKDQRRAFDAIIGSGITLVTLTHDERDAFRRRTRVVWDDLAEKLYPRSLLDDIMRALETFRKKRGAYVSTHAPTP